MGGTIVCVNGPVRGPLDSWGRFPAALPQPITPMNRCAELQRLIDQKAELIEQIKHNRENLELLLRVAYVEQEIRTFREQKVTPFRRTLAAVQRMLNV